MTITTEDIDFAIESKDESTGSIIVNYWAKNYTPQCRQNLSLPIDQATSSIPTGEALTAFIMQFAPLDYLNTEVARYKASVLVDYTEIDQLIEEGKKKVPPPM